MRPGDLGFVGRGRELAGAGSVIEAAAGGRGGLLLVTGEAGMGKTRLAEESARIAVERGFDVQWGTAWEGGGAPPFWPWVQALRDLPGIEERPELAALFGDAAHETDSAMAAEGARFRMFDAIARLVEDVARTRPLLIVLDDLHWADAGSLHLLAFVAPRLRAMRAVVLGTVRYEELGAGLAEPMGALARLAERVDLSGLENEAVDELLEQATGRPPGASVAAAIRQRTAGNPFYVRELARLGDPQWQSWVPNSVGEVVRRRVARFSPEVGAALQAGAVLGQAFGLELLQSVTGRSREELLEAMDAAVAGGLVREAGPAGWRFVHALARDALYEDLGTRQRVALHLAAGEELERQGGIAGEIALHLSRAGDRRAGGQALRAGLQALERLAPEQAVDQLRLAADLLEDDSLRLDALIALATALDRSGRLEECLAAATAAADLADRLGDPFRQARAVQAYKRSPEAIASGLPDPEGERLVTRALAALGGDDTVERALLLNYLGRDVYLFDPARAQLLYREARAIAERLDDPLALGWSLALIAQNVHGRIDVEQQLAEGRRAVETLERAGVPEYEIVARTVVTVALLQLGRLDELSRMITEIDQLAERRGVRVLRLYSHFMRAMRALMEGRLDEAERGARGAFRAALGSMRAAAMAHGYIQLFHIEIERGRGAQTLQVLDAHVAEHPESSDYTHCMHALAAACAGERERAHRLMDRFYVPEFTQALPMVNWTMHVAMLAEACMLLGDAKRAAPIYEPLARHSGHLCVAGFPTYCGGPVDLVLGRIAALTGRSQVAEGHLRDAIEQSDRLGMPIHAGHARVDLSLLLGDPEPARRALEDARRHGYARVAQRAAEALGGIAEVRVLGPLEVKVSGRDVQLPALRSARSLLALLALERRVYSRTELAERFWPGFLDESARTSLRTALAALRKALGPDADRIVRIQRDSVSLAADVRTDVEELDTATPEAALALFRGPLLSGLDDDWVVERRDELRERAGNLHRQVAESAEARGDAQSAIDATRAWVALDPLDERPVRELMRRLHAAGDKGGALAAYERLSERMREALDSAPTAATRALARALRQGAMGGDVVTLLFSDVVGSTAMLQRMGEEAGEQVLREHLDQLGALVAAAGGAVVKHLGDGVMAAFTSAVDAVGAAIAIQRGVQGIEVRIGINAGEPSRVGDDWLGTPVVVAERLCGQAGGGQILASSVVRGLVGARYEFDDVGPLALKGIAEEVPAASVRWQ